MHLRDGSPLYAYVLLGLVLLAADLLMAGYGAPVGVGVIVGLLLGAMAAVAFVALGARRSSRSWSGYYSSSGASGTAVNEPDHDLIQRHGFDSMRVMGVDAGSLGRVIPVGVGVVASGTRVELTAVELRDHGGIATCVVHTRPPVGHVGPFVEVTVSDDAATPYVASGQGSGGSGAETSRHEIRFAPAPMDGATVLTIHIARFLNPFPGPSVGLDGPWEFNVPL
jgi:hypothetical protein